MNTFDADRLAALAERLQLTPRQLLALAARIATATPDAQLRAAQLDGTIAQVRDAAEAAENAVDLLLLDYGAFAPDDIERGLALALSPTQAKGL